MSLAPGSLGRGSVVSALMKPGARRTSVVRGAPAPRRTSLAAATAGQRRGSLAATIGMMSFSEEEDDDSEGGVEEDTPRTPAGGGYTMEMGPLSQLRNRVNILAGQSQDFHFRVMRTASPTPLPSASKKFTFDAEDLRPTRRASVGRRGSAVAQPLGSLLSPMRKPGKALSSTPSVASPPPSTMAGRVQATIAAARNEDFEQGEEEVRRERRPSLSQSTVTARRGSMVRGKLAPIGEPVGTPTAAASPLRKAVVVSPNQGGEGHVLDLVESPKRQSLPALQRPASALRPLSPPASARSQSAALLAPPSARSPVAAPPVAVENLTTATTPPRRTVPSTTPSVTPVRTPSKLRQLQPLPASPSAAAPQRRTPVHSFPSADSLPPAKTMSGYVGPLPGRAMAAKPGSSKQVTPTTTPKTKPKPRGAPRKDLSVSIKGVAPAIGPRTPHTAVLPGPVARHTPTTAPGKAGPPRRRRLSVPELPSQRKATARFKTAVTKVQAVNRFKTSVAVTNIEFGGADRRERRQSLPTSLKALKAKPLKPLATPKPEKEAVAPSPLKVTAGKPAPVVVMVEKPAGEGGEKVSTPRGREPDPVSAGASPSSSVSTVASADGSVAVVKSPLAVASMPKLQPPPKRDYREKFAQRGPEFSPFAVPVSEAVAAAAAALEAVQHLQQPQALEPVEGGPQGADVAATFRAPEVDETYVGPMPGRRPLAATAPVLAPAAGTPQADPNLSASAPAPERPRKPSGLLDGLEVRRPSALTQTVAWSSSANVASELQAAAFGGSPSPTAARAAAFSFPDTDHGGDADPTENALSFPTDMLVPGIVCDACLESKAEGMHFAALMGHVTCLEVLVEHEGTMEMVVDSFGRTPLFYAASECHADCVSLLVDVRPEWMDSGDYNGDTPMHCAASRGHSDIVLFLLQSGAPPGLANYWGLTPIHVAKTASIIGHLLEFGADTSCVDSHGRTPLFTMAAMGRIRSVAVLLEHGDDAALNLPDERGDTPLHAAACYGRRNVSRVLLEWGADSTLINTLGLTPLALAHLNNHPRTEELLQWSSGFEGGQAQ